MRTKVDDSGKYLIVTRGIACITFGKQPYEHTNLRTIIILETYVLQRNIMAVHKSITENFYSESQKWHETIGKIYALSERVTMSEERSSDVLKPRKLNRIMSIHASTAIEGNMLTLEQVTDVINGAPVWGPPKDIKEVQNAWHAYNEMNEYDPWNYEHFLKAHAAMTDSLINESGVFRSVDVAVIGSDGRILHKCSPPEDVPDLVKELLEWGKGSEAHPLIKSSAVHYMIEHIHPFRDGNGRIGRLWQTLILSQWDPLFAWMPVETLIHHNQRQYYKALRDSNRNELDCRPFIDFMLNVIEDSLHKYINIPFEENVGVNVGVKETILKMIENDPNVSAKDIAAAIGRSGRTVERYIKELREQGVLKRIGSDKSGEWQVVK